MAIFGDSNTPGTGYFFDTTGNKEFWAAGQFSMPGGLATDMYVYCAGDGASVTGQLVIWDSGANIYWQSGNLTLPSGSRTIHGQSWVHASIPSVYLPPGNYELGFWSSGNVVWTFEGTGGVNSRTGLSSPGQNTGTNDEYGGLGYGRLGAYVVYSPGVIRGRRSGAWVAASSLKGRRVSAWQGFGPNGRRGGTWHIPT